MGTKLSLNKGKNLFFILTLFVIGLTSCSDKVSQTGEADEEEYLTYENDGLQLNYPANWNKVYDETGLISGRLISFETPEASSIQVELYESDTKTTKNIADKYASRFKLKENPDIKNYQREPIEISGFKGIKLTWIDTLIFGTENQVLYFKIGKSPVSTFVKFHFFDSDIQQESVHILPFLKGIKIDK